MLGTWAKTLSEVGQGGAHLYPNILEAEVEMPVGSVPGWYTKQYIVSKKKKNPN